MSKWNVTVSLQTGVYLKEVIANDPSTLIEGDLNEADVIKALIEQLQSGDSTLDWVVEEVQTLDGRVVRFDDEDRVWLGDAV
jgi:uncharacterized protein with gpF-like domain